jgi:PadR family transcriptional regulator PadR
LLLYYFCNKEEIHPNTWSVERRTTTMSIKTLPTLTRNEELILLAVWRLQQDAYGAAIHDHLSEATGDKWSIAGVYNPLNRMARAGLVMTRVGPPTPERGGRSKRYFYLTKKGLSALNANRAVANRMWAGLPKLAFNG